MTHRSLPPRRIAVSLTLLLGCATASAAAPTSAPATLPALPSPSRVAELDDAAFVALCYHLYPRPGDTVGAIYGNDQDVDLRQAVGTELRARGERRLATHLAAEPSPDPAKLEDTAIDLLLRAADGDDRGERYDDDAGRKLRRRQADCIEPVAREALRRGGWLAALAVDRWPLRDLAWTDDGQLRDLFALTHGESGRWSGGRHNGERTLTEILRRGGPVWAKVLADDVSGRRRAAAAEADEIAQLESQPSLALVTALRRIQGKPDPVAVEVDGPDRIASVFPALPETAVALVNRDRDRDPIYIQQGGDYRSGRQARWRLDVRDAARKPVPVRPMLSGIGGGMSSRGSLAPGERWETSLRMESFVPALPPGEYTLRVLYHDDVCIADEDDIEGLIVCISPPLKLKVNPLELDAAAVEAGRRVPDLLAAIPDAPKLKLVAGSYGEWAHELVPPESAHGKLLAIGLPALPPLLDALDDPKLTPARRALVLSLLFSVTGQNDPRGRPRAGAIPVGGGAVVDRRRRQLRRRPGQQRLARRNN